MAHRAHRRRDSRGRFLKTARHNPPKRRKSSSKRRGRSAVVIVNPHHRKHATATHHRRRARHNPPRLGGLVRANVSAIGNGLAVSVGRLVTRKGRGAAQGVVGTGSNVSKGLPGLATTSASAIVVTALAAMLAPARWRNAAAYVAAGAWSEAIEFAAALTPAAKYLGAFPVRRSLPSVGAYVAGRGGMGAYVPALPRAGVGAYASRSRVVGTMHGVGY